jgi:hypothetical protein
MSLAVDAKKGKPKKCEIKGVPDQECFFYGDARADAPELAYRGSFDVGVRTLEVVNPNQIDYIQNIIKILRDDDLYRTLQNNIKEYVKNFSSWTIIAQQHIKVYRSVVRVPYGRAKYVYWEEEK